MIKTPNDPVAAPDSVAVLKMPAVFPSPPLVLLNVLSCFLATAALMASLTQINMWVPWLLAILPPVIGFLATIPFHLFLYVFARRHSESVRRGFSGDTSLLPMWCFVYIFLLVALWLVIFILEILCCVGGASFGVVVATIFVGFECIISAILAIKCVLESWEVEDMNNKIRNQPISSDPESGETLASDEATINMGSPSYPRPKPKYLYLVSWVLATLAFLSSISPSITLIVDIPVYIFTVIAHVPMFVSSGISKRSGVHTWFGGAGVSFLLVILWCIVLLVNILGNILVFQEVLSGLFGVAECLVVGYIAIYHIMESVSPSHGQVRLD